jgi:hypothetical protein
LLACAAALRSGLETPRASDSSTSSASRHIGDGHQSASIYASIATNQRPLLAPHCIITAALPCDSSLFLFAPHDDLIRSSSAIEPPPSSRQSPTTHNNEVSASSSSTLPSPSSPSSPSSSSLAQLPPDGLTIDSSAPVVNVTTAPVSPSSPLSGNQPPSAWTTAMVASGAPMVAVLSSWFRQPFAMRVQGWLIKIGGGSSRLGRRTLKQRWFVLCDSQLCYWPSHQAELRGDPPCKGRVIDITSRSVRIVDAKRFQFEIGGLKRNSDSKRNLTNNITTVTSPSSSPSNDDPNTLTAGHTPNFTSIFDTATPTPRNTTIGIHATSTMSGSRSCDQLTGHIQQKQPNAAGVLMPPPPPRQPLINIGDINKTQPTTTTTRSSAPASMLAVTPTVAPSPSPSPAALMATPITIPPSSSSQQSNEKTSTAGSSWPSASSAPFLPFAPSQLPPILSPSPLLSSSPPILSSTSIVTPSTSSTSSALSSALAIRSPPPISSHSPHILPSSPSLAASSLLSSPLSMMVIGTPVHSGALFVTTSPTLCAMSPASALISSLAHVANNDHDVSDDDIYTPRSVNSNSSEATTPVTPRQPFDFVLNSPVAIAASASASTPRSNASATVVSPSSHHRHGGGSSHRVAKASSRVVASVHGTLRGPISSLSTNASSTPTASSISSLTTSSVSSLSASEGHRSYQLYAYDMASMLQWVGLLRTAASTSSTTPSNRPSPLSPPHISITSTPPTR